VSLIENPAEFREVLATDQGQELVLDVALEGKRFPVCVIVERKKIKLQKDGPPHRYDLYGFQPKTGVYRFKRSVAELPYGVPLVKRTSERMEVTS